MTVQNPFFHRGPIRDSLHFFGRQATVEQIRSLLANGQSVSVVGQRRIGKTSLLFHLPASGSLTPNETPAGNPLFVYLDCGGLTGLPAAELYQVLLEETADTLAEQGENDSALLPPNSEGTVTYRSFERSLRNLTRRGWPIIFVLDEFERLALNPQLDPDVFSGLRALTARYPITFVTASKRPLLELTFANASALSSPFFNIFASVRLGLFSEAESVQLVVSLAAQAGLKFPPSTVEVLLELAGLHPLFLQIAGFHAFELQQAKGSPLAEGDYREAERRFQDSAVDHWRYYWQNLSPSAQRMLATLSAAQAGQPEILRDLERDCLIRRRADRYDYLSPAFAQFVHSQPVAGLKQAGSLRIDEAQRQMFLLGSPLDLTPTQYDLLLCLVNRAGQVLSPETLETALWGDAYIEDPERLKSALKGLRRALGHEADRLENVRGVGYLWRR
jgi:hypothetical protein